MPTKVARYVRALSALGTVAILATCGGGSPASVSLTQPTQSTAPASPAPPAVTVSSITVGTAGNAAAAVAPGEKLQLFAQAINSDSSVTDITNIAVWQSSNPAGGHGISHRPAQRGGPWSPRRQRRRNSGRSGSLHADVQQPGCRVTLSPSSLVFGALSSSGYVVVTATQSDCRWTARSDASWLSFQDHPNRSGDGSFSYSVPGNNSTDARDARIVVTVAGGPASIHTIHQERPVGCVYTVAPQKIAFGQAGGRGSFNVTTQPGDCQWKITSSWAGVTITSATTGTGAGTVTYTVAPGASVYGAGHMPFRD